MSNLGNKLSPEELKMERAALDGANRPASEARKDKLRASAQATLDERKKPVNIRLDPADLAALKERATDSGLGYQTLIASVLHRFIAGGLVDRQVVDEIRLMFLKSGGQGAAVAALVRDEALSARRTVKASRKRVGDNGKIK